MAVDLQMMNVGNNVTDNVVSNVVSVSQVHLTERQREIYKLIKANSFISSKQMSVVLSVFIEPFSVTLQLCRKQA